VIQIEAMAHKASRSGLAAGDLPSSRVQGLMYSVMAQPTLISDQDWFHGPFRSPQRILMPTSGTSSPGRADGLSVRPGQ
jgi:hypothetical protein